MIRERLASNPRVLRQLAANPTERAKLERGLRNYLFNRDTYSEIDRRRMDPFYAKVQAALKQVAAPSVVEVKA